MTPTRTPEGKWVVYRVSTGERLERWPVDAREMLATGEYRSTAEAAVAADPTADAPETIDAPAPLAPVPTVVTKAEDAAPAKPVTMPTSRTPPKAK